MTSRDPLRTRALASLVLAVLAACGRSDRSQGALPPPTAGPIVVFAVDGLEWDVVLPLVREGRMPHLAALLERGSYGLLETFVPTASPVIWTTVATGKDWRKHGIAHFAKMRQGAPTELYDRRDRRTKALWNILSDHDRTVASIGWWMTFPAEEVDGVMVAQTNTRAQLDIRYARNVWKGTLVKGVEGQVHPPERQNEMIAHLEAVEAELPELTREIFGEFPHPLAVLGEALWKNCRWAFRADATYLRIALALAEDPADVTLVYFGGPDVVGHRFWRYAFPHLYRHPPSQEEIENFGDVVADYYAFSDRSLGRLIEAYGPDATYFVLSDHGMHAVNTDVAMARDEAPPSPNSGHHENGTPGVFVAAGPDVRPSAPGVDPATLRRADLPRVGSVLDFTPTLLALLRIPVGEDMDGSPLTTILRDGFEAERQPDPVPTHDDAEFFRRQATTPELEHAGEEERLQQLRDLGYIGD